MKKLLSLFLILSIMLSLSVCALASNKSVEISFFVGDSTLTINSEPVTVETAPYVVGVGVTLVPVRVITEAFGAVVDWNQETQTVGLTYPDVDIKLQIGNPIAEVNGKAEELLSAPELKNGRTMIPLRFISETFGAEVSYDDATAKITVTKKGSAAGSATVESGVTNKRIGDSYYGWSMENPVDMQMEYRAFDGVQTVFTYDDNNFFGVQIGLVDDDYDFERNFVEMKASFEEYTLVKAEKDSSNASKKSMHFQAKNKTEYINAIYYVTDYYTYMISGIFSNDDTEKRDGFIEIMSTFDTGFTGSDIYDLSNVKDGIRKFEAEHLNLSFEVPADFVLISDEDSENEFRFARASTTDLATGASMLVYSKSSVTSAKALAESDYKLNKTMMNEDIATYRPINPVTYNGFSGYLYNYELALSTGKEVGKDAFFELGDYVYNIRVSSKYPNSEGDSSAYMDKILNSVSAKEIDSSKVGTLMRNIRESTGSIKHSVDNVDFTVPNSYEVEEINGITAFYNPATDVLLTYSAELDTDLDFKDASRILNELKSSKKKSGFNVVTDTYTRHVHDSSYAHMVLSEKKDSGIVYYGYYLTVKKNVAYIFEVSYSELAYSKFCRDEVEAIIGSMKINVPRAGV